MGVIKGNEIFLDYYSWGKWFSRNNGEEMDQVSMTENDVLIAATAGDKQGGSRTSLCLCWNIKETLLRPEGNTEINKFNQHF